MRIFRVTKALVLGALLAASLSLNIATVAFSSVAMLVSTAYEAVTGVASVAGGLRRDVDAKTKTVASLSDEVEIRDRRIANAINDIATRDRRIASLSDEVAALKAERVVSYRGQRKLLGEAVEDTTGRISRRMATGAARNAGSVFAEAIPIAGIAVILGVTAWDLKDRCDTMHDLHELELAFNPDVGLDPKAKEVCGLEVPTKDEVWQAAKSSPSKAWNAAKAYLPELPDWQAAWDATKGYFLELPKLGMPVIDWTFWD